MGAPIVDVDDNLRLLGTAHVATASVEAVKQNIEEWKPDIVAVELCKSRFEALTQDRRLDKDCLLYTSPSPRDQRGSRMAACG